MMLGIPYRHKETGAFYKLLGVAVNKSAGMNGALMAVYCPSDDEHTLYVRKQSEFNDLFEIAMETQP